MTEGMSDAVVDAGITWVDACARPATTGRPSEFGCYQDPLGNQALSFQLSPADRGNFFAAHLAEARCNAGYALGAKVAWTIGSAARNGATGGSLSLFTTVAGTAVVNPLIEDVFSAGPPPTDQTPQTREELFHTQRLNQSAERNYFLLSAYQRAGVDLSGQFPELYQPDGSLRPYAGLVSGDRSADLRQDLQQAQNDAQESWQRVPGRGDIDVSQFYDTERTSITNGSHWRNHPSESGWTDERTARQRLYGERYVGDGELGGWFHDGGIEPVFAQRVPADPGEFYRPG
jgi:hypothetical protein